jgi:hypothetical protein
VGGRMMGHDGDARLFLSKSNIIYLTASLKLLVFCFTQADFLSVIPSYLDDKLGAHT